MRCGFTLVATAVHSIWTWGDENLHGVSQTSWHTTKAGMQCAASHTLNFLIKLSNQNYVSGIDNLFLINWQLSKRMYECFCQDKLLTAEWSMEIQHVALKGRKKSVILPLQLHLQGKTPQCWLQSHLQRKAQWCCLHIHTQRGKLFDISMITLCACVLTLNWSRHEEMVFPGSVAEALEQTWQEKSSKQGGPTWESILF